MPESQEYALSLQGIEEELFPDLVFKLVENLRIEKVQGRNWHEELLDYLA